MTFQLQNKSKLAVAALIDVALRNEHGPVVLCDVGSRQRISRTYLELMFKAFRKSGLVVSERGPGGGYLLARSAAEITVADVISAIGTLSYQPPRRQPSTLEGHAVASLDEAVHLSAVELMGTVTLSMLALQQPRPRPPRLQRGAQAPLLTPKPLNIRGIANSVFDLASKLPT